VSAARLEHYVDRGPFDPQSDERLSPELERYYLSSQWRMMWLKLRRHRLAVISGVVLALLYASIMVSEVLAPYGPNTRHTNHIYAPPQGVHLFHEGRLVGPYVHPYKFTFNLETFRRDYVIDATVAQPDLRWIVARIRADGPLIPPLTLALGRWIAEHYLAPVAMVLRSMLPPGMLERLEVLAEVTPAGEAVLRDPEGQDGQDVREPRNP